MSAIDFPAVADAENQDQHLVILDPANEPVVADTIFPELPQLGTAQGLPYAARTLEGSQPLAKEVQDALCLRWGKLVQFAGNLPGQLNLPVHALPRHPQV